MCISSFRGIPLVQLKTSCENEQRQLTFERVRKAHRLANCWQVNLVSPTWRFLIKTQEHRPPMAGSKKPKAERPYSNKRSSHQMHHLLKSRCPKVFLFFANTRLGRRRYIRGFLLRDAKAYIFFPPPLSPELCPSADFLSLRQEQRG